MANDKSFLTYNQQMKKLRKDKRIDCNGTPHKISLVRSGYFNMINGYKMPFTCGTDAHGNHIYFPNTTLSQINSLMNRLDYFYLSTSLKLKKKLGL